MSLYRVAVLGVNTETKAKIQDYIDKTYPKTDNEENQVELVDISGMSLKDLHKNKHIYSIFYDIGIHETPDEKLLGDFCSLITNEEEIDSFRIQPVCSGSAYEETINNETAKVRELYTNLSDDQKKRVNVTPHDIAKDRDSEAFLDISLKRRIDDIFNIDKTQAERKAMDHETLLNGLEKKSPYLRGHIERVAGISKLLAIKCAELDGPEKWSESAIEQAYDVGLEHDTGKIAVDSDILNSSKTYAYGSEERKQLNAHAIAGLAFINKNLEEYSAEHDYAISGHHNHIKLSEIAENSSYVESDYKKIVEIGDCFDAMMSQRSYNFRKNIIDACRDLLCSTTNNPYSREQLDVEMTRRFVRLLGEQIASIGFDPTEMIKAVKGQCYDSRIRDYTEVVDNELLELFDGIQVNKDADPTKSCTLGFTLNENMQAVFENEKKYKVELEYSPEEIEASQVQGDVTFNFYRKHKPEIDARIGIEVRGFPSYDDIVSVLTNEEKKDISTSKDETLQKRKEFREKIYEAGKNVINKSKGLSLNKQEDPILSQGIDETIDKTTYGDILSQARTINQNIAVSQDQMRRNNEKETKQNTNESRE